MGQNNGSNNIPGWVKLDLQMLKRVSVSLVEMMRESRQESREMKQEFRDMHLENQRRMAENEKMIAEVLRRNDGLEEQTASLKEQTASLRRLSDIHSKSILKLLKKI